MILKRLKSTIHKTLGGFMAVWLSGVVFLLCCHVQNTRAADMESCPLIKLGAHCDKGEKEKNSEKVEKQSNGQEMDCCAFIPALFDKTRRIDNNQQMAAIAPVLSVFPPKLVLVTANFAAARSYLPTALLKNKTFLKNRTFRI